MDYQSSGLTASNYLETPRPGKSDVTKLVIGALSGAAVGLLLGGAFTQKGMKLRSQVAGRGRNIAGNLSHKVSNLSSAIADKYGSAKEGTANLIEKGKQKVGLTSHTTSVTQAPGFMSTTTTTEKEQGSKILLGALIVSVAGTLVWSFATEKGNETRNKLASGTRNLTSNFKEKATGIVGEFASAIADTYKAAKEGAVDLLDQEMQKRNIVTSSFRNSVSGNTQGQQ